MSPVHDEHAFGTAIVTALRDNGWREANPEDYRPDLGLDTNELFTFIGRTQPEEWYELCGIYGTQEEAQRGFAKRLDRAIADEGVLNVLRNGVKDQGVRLRVAFFKPNLVVDASALDGYKANRLTVIRELPYATKQADWGHRLDLALFLNGIPVATAELKNPLTGQGAEQAKEQYRTDRDPTELIFTRRVIANFAIDPDLVFVATQLKGRNTRFLPFNTGSNGPGLPGGSGNPAPTAFGKYATSYLWENVWARDNWLDLLQRFAHQQKQKATPGSPTTRTTIFPRYHQWDVVKKLTAHAATHGAGENYLIMASAGSGKSNTIGWLVHRLSDLHADTDPRVLDQQALTAGRISPGEPVFDKVIVITDRRNLDAQLRETVGSFSQTEGLVVKIDEKHGAKSEQLARALSRDTGKIVTVTLHTFPALLNYLKRNPTEISGSRFAIVIDEAHSSQSGDAAKGVKSALRDLGLDSDSDDAGAVTTTVNDQLKKQAEERSHADNLSYFAFTATPKAKTLELFGTPATENGKDVYRPFHTYSMRQAIEEGFILDPLRNYVTYNTYWKLVNQNPDEKEVDPSKANSLLARFALTHEHTVSQQAIVIVEHFLAHTRGRLGGRAKSMVVTASRHSAVQMARAIKSYIQDREYDTKYPDLGVLVAFSGALTIDDEETTEPKENGGLSESALPKAFAYVRADDKAVKAGGKGQPEYKILVVAEKYQTGFDQPLLTTMYVNKTLTGIAAVQTLSRLNRTADRKSQADLAVLDFVNDAEDIKEAFRPYFEEATTLPSDPNLLYTAQSRVMSAPVIAEQEMDEFAAAYFAAKEKAAGSQARWEKLHAELYRMLSPAVARFANLIADEDDEDSIAVAEDFRADLNDYVRKYGFLAQIVPYHDPDLERLHLYGRYLLNRLPRRADGGVDIGEVDLSHLRVEKTGEYDVSLNPEGPAELKGFGDGTGGAKDAEKSLLSELIDKFNSKYGTEFTEEDVLPAFNAAKNDPKVRAAAVVNDEENFGVVFDKAFNGYMMDHVSTVDTLGKRYFGADRGFKSNLDRSARRAAWRMIRDEEGLDE